MRPVLAMLLAAGAAIGAGEATFAEAVARAPAVAAARLAATAAGRAEAAAGVLPDPMLGVDAGRERNRMGERMIMYGAMIEQPLPRWGERDAMRLAARARLRSAEAGVLAIAGEHAAAIAAMLAEREAASETATALRGVRTRVEALRAAVRTRLAAGGGTIDAQLALDTRAEALDLRLADLLRRAADAEGEVRGRLGLPPGAPLPAFAAPDPATVDAALAPMVRSAAAMRLEAEAMEREAEARGNPETALSLAWEREAAGSEEQTDSLSIGLRVSLPVHRGAYRAAADAARARARAAGHEADGAVWMARSLVERAQRAAVQAARAEATAAAVAGRARTAYEAAVSRVASGAAPVGDALGLLDMAADAEIEAVMARQGSRMAQAELWRLAPPDLPAASAEPPSHQHQPGVATP